jgi:hypothetical protein
MCVLCTLRTHISRSIRDFTHDRFLKLVVTSTNEDAYQHQFLSGVGGANYELQYTAVDFADNFAQCTYTFQVRSITLAPVNHALSFFIPFFVPYHTRLFNHACVCQPLHSLFIASYSFVPYQVRWITPAFVSFESFLPYRTCAFIRHV